MRLRLTPRALDDINDIAEYISARIPVSAQRVGGELQRAFRLLTAHPWAGRAVAGGRRRFTPRRFPYLIFYQVDRVRDEVVILTVRHGARRPTTGN